MKFIEPTFDPAGGAWPLPSNTHQKDISGLENKIAKQSSELNLRLTEILELYNLQSRHANELDTAHEEISRLQRIVAALHGNLKQQKIDAATAQDKITDLENDKAVLRANSIKLFKLSRWQVACTLCRQRSMQGKQTPLQR